MSNSNHSSPQASVLGDIAERSNLTHNQLQIWLGQQLSPDKPLYNMAHTFTIEGVVDPRLFRRAFQHTVDSSDVLRTVIEEIDRIPQQRVLSEYQIDLPFLDFSEDADPQRSLKTWLEQRKQTIFDLSVCHYDAALIKISETSWVWYYNHHHITTDRQSTMLVYEAVETHYRSLKGGDERAPQGIPPYLDYVADERARRGSKKSQKAEAFWQAKLATPLEPLSFYGHTAQADLNETERLVLDISPQKSAHIRQIAEQEGIRSFSLELTLLNIFNALFFTFLHRISGQTKIGIGSPFHNRTKAVHQKTPGLFINIFPLQLAIEPDETFRSLLDKGLNELMDNLGRADYPVSQAVNHPVFHAVLNFITIPSKSFSGQPMHFDWLHPGYGDASHPVRLQVNQKESNGDFVLFFDLNRQIFNADMRQEVVTQFAEVLGQFVRDQDQKLSEVRLLNETSYDRLIVQYNDSAAPFPADKTIVQLFEAQAARTPEAVAVRHNGESLTYAELNRRANRLAHTLRQRGVKPGDLIGICLDHSLETIVGLLAILKARAAYVPFDPTYPQNRLDYMRSDADVRIVLTEARYRALFQTATVFCLDTDWEEVASASGDNPGLNVQPDDLAYVIYTSGSTGKPKGVLLGHRGLTNYIWWAKGQYSGQNAYDFPLFSSLSFDLTITSLYVPLISGGKIVIYTEEDEAARRLLILRVFEDDAVDVVKLTPSHLALVGERGLKPKRIKCLIVGGEDFKTELAHKISELFDHKVQIYNEYGPTEATVGCMIHRYDPVKDTKPSVPIGIPAANAQIYVMDSLQQPVATGVIGEITIGGFGLAKGYLNRKELNDERFIDNPLHSGTRLYRSGDLARWLPDGQIEFLGRADHQVKIRGGRIELGEIEAALWSHPDISAAAVVTTRLEAGPKAVAAPLIHCIRCGLASDYPNITFDDQGLCSICEQFETYQDAAQAYFKDMEAFAGLAEQMKADRRGDYDCILLMSGGKDSTYVLYQLVQHGLKPLVFTLDNGFISDGAKANIKRVVDTLGVDHVFGSTPAMNEIFADSLNQFSNVCNGCFKVIYTLATNIAHKKDIRYIVTGLSRGQFFETRLTPELFREGTFQPDEIDQTVLEARKAYHRQPDAVSRLLDVEIFQDDALFERIQYIDFYRYCDVDLEDVYAFLEDFARWIRPEDTGRSTNCLINDAGIYTHKIERGHHNYALPYSWDVRMGHKNRAEALAELDDEIDEEYVQSILETVGYKPKAVRAEEAQLAAYYVSGKTLTNSELRDHLAGTLPDFMLPALFIPLAELPLTPNGKVDRRALPAPDDQRPSLKTAYEAPRSEVERFLAEIWKTVLNLKDVGIHDHFFDLGGHSLPGIQVIASVRHHYEVDIPLRDFFNSPTIASLSAMIEDRLVEAIHEMSDEEAARLLAELEQS